MTCDFSTTVHGKWIVAGEHSVLRGSPALAFPVYGKSLTLRWQASANGSVHNSSSFSSHFSGDRGPEFQLLFTGVFDRALEILGRSGDASLRRGDFLVESTLPVGAGLGASAALSVAVGRWFVSQNAIKETELFDFCRNLEDLFHGESSGVDVAVAIENRGLHFERHGPKENRMRGFDPSWQPIWYISYSGTRGITSECVSKVKSLIASDSIRGARLDEQMARAVRQAEEALLLPEEAVKPARSEPAVLKAPIHGRELRFEKLRSAILLAGECFKLWGLSEGTMGTHLDWLTAQGASAVKPTGSGGGGYALSLWRERPAPSVEEHLIPVFKT